MAAAINGKGARARSPAHSYTAGDWANIPPLQSRHVIALKPALIERLHGLGFHTVCAQLLLIACA